MSVNPPEPPTELILIVPPVDTVDKVAVPEFELALVAEKVDTPVAFMVAPLETINTSKVLISLIISVPLVILKVSFPPPPEIISLPSPPVIMSVEVLPTMVNPSD